MVELPVPVGINTGSAAWRVETLMNNNTASAGEKFSPDITLEQFKIDLANIHLHHVRLVSHLADPEKAWRILWDRSGDTARVSAPDLSFMDPILNAQDLKFDFDGIRNTPFARTMLTIYDYAYLGRQDPALARAYENPQYQWSVILCSDAATSAISHGLQAMYNWTMHQSALNCMHVIEIAHARIIMEEDIPFCQLPDVQELNAYGGLSMRQMALVAGMTEASLRSMTNSKRNNPLKTRKQGNTTYVDPSDAKDWLKATGRYVPITRKPDLPRTIDWAGEKFDSVASFNDALNRQLGLLDKAALDIPDFAFTLDQLRDPALVRKAAAALDVDEALLQCCASEARHHEELRRLEQERRRIWMAGQAA